MLSRKLYLTLFTVAIMMASQVQCQDEEEKTHPSIYCTDLASSFNQKIIDILKEYRYMDPGYFDIINIGSNLISTATEIYDDVMFVKQDSYCRTCYLAWRPRLKPFINKWKYAIKETGIWNIGIEDLRAFYDDMLYTIEEYLPLCIEEYRKNPVERSDEELVRIMSQPDLTLEGEIFDMGKPAVELELDL